MNDVLYVTPITDNEPTDSLRINDLVALCFNILAVLIGHQEGHPVFKKSYNIPKRLH